MSDAQPLIARFGEFALDEANARLLLAGRPVELPPKAFGVLCELVRSHGRLVVKEALLDAVWGHQHISESVLKTTVSQVRAALADDAKQPRYIETASRRGYRFIATLESPAPAAGPSTDGAPTVSVPTLIGRGPETRLLGDRLEAVAAGARHIVLVAGEPGIGKSTLIEGFVAAQAGRPVTVATGQCIEHFGAGEAYMPVLDALNGLARGDDGALLPLMRRVAPTWLVQLPWYVTDDDRQQLQREVAGATQDRMLREFGELVDRIAERRPLVLVLEDLHWSDHATVQLLGYVARRRGRARLLVVGSFRPTEIIVNEHPLKGMRQELRLHRLCEELDLEAFSERDVAGYLAQRFDGQPFPEDFVRALHGHTEGLPLFLVNVVDELIAEDAMRHENGAWVVPPSDALGIPQSIAGVIEKQIARLPEHERQWLVVASVVGSEFVHTHIADALDIEPGPLHEGLDRVARRGDWLRSLGVVTLHDGRIGSRYAFRHALYRHVFYMQAGNAERMHLHRRVAAALLRCYCTGTTEIAAELAMHYERGNDIPQAIACLQVAANKALRLYAASEALQAARHALRLLAALPDAGERLEAELELRVIEGVALTNQQMFSEREVAAAFERAHELLDKLPESPTRARVLHGMWWVNFGRGELRRALALATRIATLGDAEGDPALQITGSIALGSTLTHMGQFAAAQAHLERGLAVFEASESLLPPGMFIQDPGVELLSYLALLLWWRGEPGRSRKTIAAAIERADRLRHPLSMLMALHFHGSLELQDGQFEAALAASDRAFALLTDKAMGGPATHAWFRGRALAALGDPEGGLAQMRAGAEDCLRRGMLLGMTGFYFLYAEACSMARRYDEALTAVQDGLALAETNAEHALVAPLMRMHGALLLARGDAAGAEATLVTARRIAAEQGARCFELGSLLTWARLPQIPPAEAAAALRKAVDGYGEGEMTMLHAARVALAEWEPGSAAAASRQH